MGIYLDNAATTYMYDEVVAAMWPYYSKAFYNPSAGYADSKRVRDKINECRQELAGLIGALPEEIYFTSGGTESDNWVCNEAARRGFHIISSEIEHNAMLNPLAEYKSRGGRVTLVPVNSEGEVNPEIIKRNITPKTGLISIMMANNEIGTIEPIEKIGHIAKEYGVIFHSDGVQAFGHIPMDVNKCNLDMLSVSSHKFHGPKGVGFLYVRKNTKIKPLILGGGQEFGMRAGTENVPGIVGMTTAAKIACRNMKNNIKSLTDIRNYMIARMQKEIPGIKINGSINNRLPNNINFSVNGIDGRSALILLEMEGIYASAGSACSSMHTEPSHVLKAIKLEEDFINGTIRISMDESMNMRKADWIIDVIVKIIKKIKKI